VQGLLLVALVRYRRGRSLRAQHSHGHPLVEFVWVAVPTVILVWLAFASQSLWARVRFPAAPPANALQVEVQGQQFAWNVRYPGPDGKFGATRGELIADDNPFGRVENDPVGADDVILINEMSLVSGRHVRLFLTSRDVIHSFFVPQFRFKQDAVPGSRIEVSFVPSKPGEFEIACAEFCGLGHYRMRGFLTVHSEAAHAQWLKERAQ